MYNLQYAEMQQDDQKESRERERLAFDISIAAMEEAVLTGMAPVNVANAINRTGKLWHVLMVDLAAADNGLPKELRAHLLSIGIWILKELEKIRNGEVKDFSELIEVSKTIRCGL